MVCGLDRFLDAVVARDEDGIGRLHDGVMVFRFLHGLPIGDPLFVDHLLESGSFVICGEKREVSEEQGEIGFIFGQCAEG